MYQIAVNFNGIGINVKRSKYVDSENKRRRHNGKRYRMKNTRTATARLGPVYTTGSQTEISWLNSYNEEQVTAG